MLVWTITWQVFSLTLTVRGVSNKHCLLTFFIEGRYLKWAATILACDISSWPDIYVYQISSKYLKGWNNYWGHKLFHLSLFKGDNSMGSRGRSFPLLRLFKGDNSKGSRGRSVPLLRLFKGDNSMGSRGSSFPLLRLFKGDNSMNSRGDQSVLNLTHRLDLYQISSKYIKRV